MPAVELVDLLRRDRDLDAAPVVAMEHLDANVRYDLNEVDELSPSDELAAGTVRIQRPSSVRLALGCLAAFATGFALTTPLWW
jgi:plasmid replication initiation protein